ESYAEPMMARRPLCDERSYLLLDGRLECPCFLCQVDLHGDSGDVEQWLFDRVVAAICEPLQNIREVPDRSAAFVYGRRKRVRVREHQLPHVLATDTDELRHVREPHEIGCDLDELRIRNRPFHIPQCADDRLFGGSRLARELKSDAPGLAGTDHRAIAAGIGQALDQLPGIGTFLADLELHPELELHDHD